jgi:hypothetical protein
MMILATVAAITAHSSPIRPASASAGVSVTVAILVAVVALAVGAVAGVIAASVWRSRSPRLSAQATAPRPPAQAATESYAPPLATTTTTTTTTTSAQAERARLVAAYADLADRLRDHQPGLFTVVTRELQAVGVSMQLPDGELFSADRHNAVGTEKTSNPSDDLRVAATTRLGYLDHGVTVRVPDVIVFRWDGANHAR